jgi:hypothetical protein
MRVRFLAPRLILGAPLALLSPGAHADPAQPAEGRADPTVGSSEPRPDDAYGATIVLIGESGGSKALPALLVELLERQGVQVRFLGEPRFEPAHLLSGGESDRAVWVFVELTRQRTARLYFRGPQARRFLLRELELRDGLDEFGLELIGQVVESSVAALLHSSAGLSREQVKVALDDANQLGDRGAARQGDAQRRIPISDDVARLAGWLGLRYAAQWSGSDLGLAHGPGAEIGIEWQGPALLRATLCAERWFAQTVASPEVKASVDSWPLRLSVDVGFPAGHAQTWLLGLAGGFDVIRVEPETLDPSVTPAGSRTHLVPMLRGALRYELGAGSWRLALTGFADVSMFETHYDLVRGSGAERLAVPWPVRPGAALVVAWRPTLSGR